MEHKWKEEIIAWAHGVQIESRYKRNGVWTEWRIQPNPKWHTSDDWEYRVYDPLREVKEAFKEGKQIQFRNETSNYVWKDCAEYKPIWNESTEYRIKPSLEDLYTPFTIEDGKGLIGRRIENKETKNIYSILAIYNRGVRTIDRFIPFENLLIEYEFMSNHEPCGHKKY